MKKTYRHSFVVRLSHWLTALCLPILMMSGFGIFNAYRHLDWGESSDLHLLTVQAFPAWATLGQGYLAFARRWHFLFAWIFVLNGLLFAVYSLWSRHFSRDLWPTKADLRSFRQTIVNHLFWRNAPSKSYNVLQKITYLVVVYGLGPLIVLTGLAMSPAMDALLPWLTVIFGGRQSARTLHFCITFLFLGFTVIHVVMVATTGFWNNMRSMLTGWYDGRNK